LTLEDGSTDCPETSVHNYKSTPLNTAEERIIMFVYFNTLTMAWSLLLLRLEKTTARYG